MGQFDYKLSSVNSVTVVTFKGKVSKDSLEKLDQCRIEVLNNESASVVIIYFKDGSYVEPAAFREFSLLQQEIRAKEISLYVTGLDSVNRQYLLDRAIVRMTELKKSLQEIFDELARPVT